MSEVNLTAMINSHVTDDAEQAKASLKTFLSTKMAEVSSSLGIGATATAETLED